MKGTHFIYLWLAGVSLFVAYRAFSGPLQTLDNNHSEQESQAQTPSFQLEPPKEPAIWFDLACWNPLGDSSGKPPGAQIDSLSIEMKSLLEPWDGMSRSLQVARYILSVETKPNVSQRLEGLQQIEANIDADSWPISTTYTSYVEERANLWQQIELCEACLTDAEDAFSNEDFSACLSEARELRYAVESIRDKESIAYLSDRIAAVEELEQRARVLNDIEMDFQALATVSVSRQRIVALRSFLKKHEHSAPLEAQDLVLQAKQEEARLVITEVENLKDLGMRIEGARRAWAEYSMPGSRSLLQSLIRDWLRDVVQLRPIPSHVNLDFKETLGFANGQIVVGNYEDIEGKENEYHFWKSAAKRHLPWRVTTDIQKWEASREQASGSDDLFRAIRRAPRETFIVRSIRDYNEAARSVLHDIGNEASWRSFAELTRTLEEEASGYRDIATDGGVYPETFAEDYRTITFAPEATAAKTIVARFADIVEILNHEID